MDEQIPNSKSNAKNDLKYQILPTRQQWGQFESNRLLLEPRKQLILIVFILLAITALALYAPLAWVLVWSLLIFGTFFWMKYLIIAYSALLKANTNAQTMTVAMAHIVRRYKMAWLINCSIWCGLSFLSQLWLPTTARLFCLGILNALMLLSITRTYVDRRLMHQVSAIFLFSQLLFVVLRLVFKGHIDDVVAQVMAYIFYLLLMSFLLWAVGNQFYLTHEQRLDFAYSKLQLIESLNQSQNQLNIEQQTLVTSNKLIQQFYSGVAHDLRQPVYAMQLYTSMLSDDSSLNKTLLPKITQSCISINDMFNTLFDYQQTHMNDIELIETEINIQETFKNLALQFHPIATGKGLQIRFKPTTGVITLVPLYLSRILSNLIANALKYTHSGGVLVGMRKTRTNVSFEIWDTGIGIDDTKIKQIFNEFYRVNKVDAENEGLGLGLAIAKQLSTRIPDADILVRSRVGRGSVFKFIVPLERYS